MGLFGDNRYFLMNKDNRILSFVCNRDIDNNPVFSVVDKYSNILPIGFTDINDWIKSRRAPKHREHIREILTKCGCDDFEGYVRFTYCAGLNDTFWVLPADKQLRWDEVSLYRNEFDENIARIAFDGGLMGEKFSSATPELSTDGSFPKCWKRFDDNIYLLKQGSSGAINAGREPYSEVYAYELAKILCDDAVEYDIIKHHGKIAAKCELFTSESISYTPIVNVMGKKATFTDILRFYDGIGAGDKFRQMIVLDALTLNTDRHLKNFGVLYDSDTMHILDMAPVFDNNLSLCPFAEPEDFEDIKRYITTRYCAFDEGFNETALMCMTRDIRERVESLRDFLFSHNHRYHLSDERLSYLEEMIHLQADNLLAGRVLIQASDVEKNINLDNMLISINKEAIDKELKEIIINEQFEITDFVIVTEKETRINVRNSKYTVFEAETEIEIELYNANVSGSCDSLVAERIEGLEFIVSGNSFPLPVDRMEIQLGAGEDYEVAIIRIENKVFE